MRSLSRVGKNAKNNRTYASGLDELIADEPALLKFGATKNCPPEAAHEARQHHLQSSINPIWTPRTLAPPSQRSCAEIAAPHVLLVDDNSMFVGAFQMFLEDAGIVVIGPCASVESALNLCRIVRVDAAILDVNLSGQMVYPVADVLSRQGVPFLFLTGFRATALPEPYQSRPTFSKASRPHAILDALKKLLEAGWSFHT